MSEKKKKKPQKRIKGKKYWELQGLMNELKEAQKALVKWQEEQAEELGLYPDQINWNNGAIFNSMVEIVDEVVINATVEGRLSHELLKENRIKIIHIQEKDDKLVAMREKMAKNLDIWPDMINFRNGVISDKEYEGVTAEEEMPKEVVAVSAKEEVKSSAPEKEKDEEKDKNR